MALAAPSEHLTQRSSRTKRSVFTCTFARDQPARGRADSIIKTVAGDAQLAGDLNTEADLADVFVSQLKPSAPRSPRRGMPTVALWWTSE